ncbi:regulatory protein RecX [Lentiprolixibacter aurantiacus]|uniref:Regulatory protein RecX n=1 Tax=Lentiprolixibacter aurantiacus TaxID=2993939 RepID=A0AAE3MJC1_9FLAO|nr:regulatory protein RecX [Lentiprolixibacter aurantiacus]MCX2718283.1 regulatory protein RecX [Lentiprolixibacter aurantiacus]
MKRQGKSYTLEEALKKMGRYCAYQDRCHQEVRQKLREMKMIPEAIDHIMAYLIEHDFLNEQRFADSFARGKFRIKKWGKLRIIRELRQREISQLAIKKSLKQITDQEYREVLDDLALKRLETLTQCTALEKKQKLSSYLLYRGWENELVYDKIRELLD